MDCLKEISELRDYIEHLHCEIARLKTENELLKYEKQKVEAEIKKLLERIDEAV
jgi:predicted  nucleic acid-binding Zn-ribbon protein